jgi:arabinogalactan endo-1,4-beta-galactosidase
MRISGAFPSDYLKAADLQGRQVKVVMSHVEMREFDEGNKPVLFFQGKEKGVVLNKTNAHTISDAFGDDTEAWHGKEIVLFEAMVDMKGRTVPAIRVRPPAQQHARPSSADMGRELPPRAAGTGTQMDDEIPF